MEMLRWRSAYAVPEGMTGTLHLAWYDPINTVANIGSPTHDGHGVRDNDATLSAAGGGLPGFTLEFTTAGPSENSDLIQKSYLAINDARYRDNFIVVAHPHTGIAETYEFRTNDDSEVALMNEQTTGLWAELPDDPDVADPPSGTLDHRTSTLTIMPSVDIDCDSDNNNVIERSDWEEEIETEADYIGKYVPFNDDDDNSNSIDDYEEQPGDPGWVAFEDDDLVQVILDRGFSDLEGMNGFKFELKLTIGADRGLSYWLDRQKTPIVGSAYDPDEIEYITENGNDKVIYRWMVASETVSYPPSIYVEGINPEALTDTLMWRLFDPSDELVDLDTVKMTDPDCFLDLDTDSDNNGNVDLSELEEYIENHEYALGKMLHYDAFHQICLDQLRNAVGYQAPGLALAKELMVLQLPDGLDPNDTNYKISFFFHNSDVSVWRLDDQNCINLELEIITNYTLGQLGYDSTTGLIPLFVIAEQDSLIHTYSDTKDHTRDIHEVKASLLYKGIVAARDTVQFTTAPCGTFYRKLNQNADLQRLLATEVVYGHVDSKQYCLEPQDDQMLQDIGFDMKSYRELITTRDVQTTVRESASGFNADIYRNFVHSELDYVLAFEGSNPSAIEDWITNVANGLGMGSDQYWNAMTLARYVCQARPALAVEDIAPEGYFGNDSFKLKEHIEIVGHSLGGGLASAAGLVSDIPTYTINASGICSEVMMKYADYEDLQWPTEEDETERDAWLNKLNDIATTGWSQTPAHITRFATRWDPLTLLQKHLDLMPEAIGVTKTIGSYTSVTLPSEYDNHVASVIGAGSDNSIERFLTDELNPAINAKGIAIDYSSIAMDIIITAIDGVSNPLGTLNDIVNSMQDAFAVFAAVTELMEIHNPEQYIYGLITAYDS